MGIAENLKRADAVALIEWWRDAGVDTLIDDAPRGWLAADAAPLAPGGKRASSPASVALAQPAPLPDTLPDFVDWMMASETLADAGLPSRRVRPSGHGSATLMILTDMPELADTDAGTLLSGPVADLFDKMLGALMHTRETAYIASLSPGRLPGGRIAGGDIDRWARLARHHVGLVRPQQLWLLGDAASRAILGVSDTAAHGQLHSVNLDGLMINAIATSHPRLLLEHPDRKARAWSDMQRLMSGGPE